MTQCVHGGRRTTCGSGFSPSPRSQNQVIGLGDKHPYLSHLGGFRPWFWILERPLTFSFYIVYWRLCKFRNFAVMTIWEHPIQTQDSERLLNQETSKAKSYLEFLPSPLRAETTGVYHLYSFHGTRAPFQGFIHIRQVLSQLNCIPEPICFFFSIMKGIYNPVRNQYIL